MRNPTSERLYNLLPAVYRLRDSEQREEMRALLGVIEGELRLLENDIGRLYDNFFIETCDEWIVPYLGDLLGVRGVGPARDGAFSQRALVANTLSYRRRKGTAAVLEQLARDTTGWSAKAVEFFELLVRTQHHNHLRPSRGGTVDLRGIDRLGAISSPFERAAHSVDVRHIANGQGKYNVPNVGLFLWRLQPYFIERGAARAVTDPADGRYRFSSLGHDMPLFNRPQTETRITQLATEENVSGPLRRRPLYDELEAARQAHIDGKAPRGLYFGERPVLQVFVDADKGPVPLEQIVVCDLSDSPLAVPEGWRRPAPTKSYEPTSGGPSQNLPIRVAVDPVLGRLAFPKDVTPGSVEISYAYGFPGDLGGGPYERREKLADPSPIRWKKTVSQHGLQADFRSLSAALAAWADSTDENRADAIITIADNATYAEAITIEMAGDQQLVIQAGNGRRPVLRCAGPQGDLVVSPPANGGQSVNASLTLTGLLIEGGIGIGPRSLGRLRIVHCTLVPGRGLEKSGRPLEPDRPSVTAADPNERLRLEIDHSITGSLRLPDGMDGLRVRDSVVDSPRAREIPALVSGNLSSVGLSSETPALNLSVGEEGPHRAAFPEDQARPTTLPQARDRLQVAIRTCHDSPGFKNARVITVPNANCLIILPGVAADLIAEAAGNDPTASELDLDSASVRRVCALVGRPLSTFARLSSASPSLNATIGSEGTHTIVLTGNPTTVVQARNSLQDAIRTVPNAPRAFAAALVGNVDDRLVVFPGVAGATVVFGATPTDQTTLTELGLESERPAIAASEDGKNPGPPTTLERTTVFGPVHVKELTLASEVIFVDPVTADRHQAGCVRFSYVPDGSRTPRQFRCQPDLAAQRELELALKSDPSMTLAEQKRIRDNARIRLAARITPSFASVRYGEPGYAQLGPSCTQEICIGSEDENEMGAFNFLQQAQRLASLRLSMDEYLRLGLEAGILLVN